MADINTPYRSKQTASTRLLAADDPVNVDLHYLAVRSLAAFLRVANETSNVFEIRESLDPVVADCLEFMSRGTPCLAPGHENEIFNVLIQHQWPKAFAGDIESLARGYIQAGYVNPNAYEVSAFQRATIEPKFLAMKKPPLQMAMRCVNLPMVSLLVEVGARTDIKPKTSSACPDMFALAAQQEADGAVERAMHSGLMRRRIAESIASASLSPKPTARRARVGL